MIERDPPLAAVLLKVREVLEELTVPRGFSGSYTFHFGSGRLVRVVPQETLGFERIEKVVIDSTP